MVTSMHSPRENKGAWNFGQNLEHGTGTPLMFHAFLFCSLNVNRRVRS